MKRVFIFLILQSFCVIHAQDFLNTVKGIGTGIAGFGKHMGSMFKNFGEDIGHGQIGKAFESLAAAPPGYKYKFTVLNDTDQTVYIKVQDYGSFMGGMFPMHGGPSSDTVGPFTQYPPTVKDYYFQMNIAGQPGSSSSSMPYTDTDSLYLLDCTHLPREKTSTKTNYFRTFIGKDVRGGGYVHGVRAESVGFSDPTSKKNKGLSTDSTITSLVIYNNTPDDIVIGYSSNKDQPLTKNNCDIVTLVEKNSFALLNPTSDKELQAGKIGIFNSNTGSLSDLYSSGQEGQAPELTFTFPQKIVSKKTYTLEIYQDKGQSSKQIGLQGIMPGNYDMPTGRVREITPIHIVFWYKAVAELDEKALKKAGASKSNYVDLPGQVWMVSKGSSGLLTSQIALGTATEIIMFRPTLAEGERWYYFVYVDTKDAKIAKQFVEKFVNGKIGKDVLDAYHTQSEKQVELAIQNQGKSASISDLKDLDAGKVPEALLLEAIKGSLAMHQGMITDPVSKIEGYLLGADVFFPHGTGAQSTYYYQLTPSNNLNKPDAKNKVYIPTTAVQNQYAYTLGSGKPKNMPTPTQAFNFTKAS